MRLNWISISLLFLLIGIVGPQNLVTENDFENGKCGSLTENKLKDGQTLPWIATLSIRTEDVPDATHPAILLSPSLVLMNANLFLEKGLIRVMKFHNLSSYSISANLSNFGLTNADDSNVQTVNVKQIRIHPEFRGRKNWTLYENDIALIHLETPFNFSSDVHGICVPTVEIANQIVTTSRQETSEARDNADVKSSVVLFGWKRNNPPNIFLRMKVNDQKTCERWWLEDEETKYSKYVHRFCANVSSDNAHQNCIHKDNGLVGRFGDKYYFLGLVNNFYSDNRICTPRARFFILQATENSALTFIDHNLRCGPDNFTCDNGRCLSLENWCDGHDDCGDKSDEKDARCEAIVFPFHCIGGQDHCGEKGKCILVSQFCDGIKDCIKGEDETTERCVPQRVRNKLWTIFAIVSVCMFVLFLIIAALWKRLLMIRRANGDLTEAEVLEFFKGIEIPVDESERGMRMYENDPVAKIPWDNSKFEIPKEKLAIHWDQILGKGAFGVVHRAAFENDESTIPVAAKSFKNTEGKAVFMSQLTELKVMTRLGHHDHIVNLIGAYTKEIQKRILYIVVELCPLGNLESYLKDNREVFLDLIDRDGNYNGKSTNNTEQMAMHVSKNKYENFKDFKKQVEFKEPQKKSFTTVDLLLWSHQIASAMEYLSSKNVNHGDLATRNVLLTEDYNAKVSDFGLSVHLYSTGMYKKRDKETPLPWRWMAIESIKDLKFSTKSDIWSYGVTLWEIFTIGLVPYPGLYYDFNFIDQLDSGMRLGEPSQGSHEIYAAMVHCWNLKPDLRPSFTYLKDLFRGLYEILVDSIDEKLVVNGAELN